MSVCVWGGMRGLLAPLLVTVRATLHALQLAKAAAAAGRGTQTFTHAAHQFARIPRAKAWPKVRDVLVDATAWGRRAGVGIVSFEGCTHIRGGCFKGQCAVILNPSCKSIGCDNPLVLQSTRSACDHHAP